MHQEETGGSPPYHSAKKNEASAEHLFRTLRHFPSISKTIPAAYDQVTRVNSQQSHYTSSSPASTQRAKAQAFKSEEKFHRRTYKLEQLCKSSLSELNTLSTFRKQIINDRLKPKTVILTTSSYESLPSDPLKRATDKLTKFSIRYDAQRVNNDLDGFQNQILNKKELDVQLKRCLCIWLSKDELDALFTDMDADGSGLIDGVEFQRYFFKLGQDARFKMRTEALENNIKREQEAKYQMERDRLM